MLIQGLLFEPFFQLFPCSRCGWFADAFVFSLFVGRFIEFGCNVVFHGQKNL